VHLSPHFEDWPKFVLGSGGGIAPRILSPQFPIQSVLKARHVKWTRLDIDWLWLRMCGTVLHFAVQYLGQL
jgi:hypothetical protein